MSKNIPPAQITPPSTVTLQHPPLPQTGSMMSYPPFLTLVLGLLLVSVIALLLRWLWQLPEALEQRGHPLVLRYGGAEGVKQALLRGVGFLAIAAGICFGQLTTALLLAVTIAIYIKVREYLSA